MFDSHLSHIKIIGDLISARKLTDAFAMLCGFDVLIWYKVIHDKCNLVLVENAVYLHFFNLMNGYR